MRRRRVIAGMVALALIAVVVVIVRPRGPRPCRATFEQVHEGMTYDEVCATVGAPSGDYSDGTVDWPPSGLRYWRHEGWIAQDAAVMVRFDDTGRAADVSTVYPLSILYQPTPWERLRRWLGF
jgi:hypothetical protein